MRMCVYLSLVSWFDAPHALLFSITLAQDFRLPPVDKGTDVTNLDLSFVLCVK